MGTETVTGASVRKRGLVFGAVKRSGKEELFMPKKRPQKCSRKKVSLAVKKVSIAKVGMNAGISGGKYQCC